MSDRRLFNNTDEQEKAYAPEHSPDRVGQTRAAVEEGTLDDNHDAVARSDWDDSTVAMPLPGPSGAIPGVGGLSGATSGAPPVGVAPTRVDDVDNDTDDLRR